MANLKKLYRVLVCSVSVAGCAGGVDSLAPDREGTATDAVEVEESKRSSTTTEEADAGLPDAGEPDAGTPDGTGGGALCPW